MSEMIERAARAIWETWPGSISPWDKRREEMKDETRKEARAALLAALDPADDGLVDAVADKAEIHQTYVRAILERLCEVITERAQAAPKEQG